MAINSVTDSTTEPRIAPTTIPTTTHKAAKKNKHEHASQSSQTATSPQTKGTVGVNIDTSKVPETTKQEGSTAAKPSINKYV